MSFSLPSVALKRPVTMLMLSISVVCLGAIAWYKIPIEFSPKFEMSFINCVIVYPGATPEQVENEVARPAEGMFRTISHLKRIMTVSDSNGCTVQMFMEPGIDMGAATAEVRDRIERLKLDLPSEVDNIFIQRFTSDMMPIMAFGIFREGDHEQLAYLGREVLTPRLMRLEGVADVEVFGKPTRDVLIEFDQQALRQRRVTIYDAVSLLQKSSLNLSLGSLQDGQTKLYVRLTGEFKNPEQIANLVVGPGMLRLKEVARVGYRSREVDREFAIDGKSGVFVMVRKEAEANTINTCKAIHQELDKLKTDPLFEGAMTFMYLDQSEIILSAIDGLLKSGKYGGALAVIILLLFLGRIRPTLIVALSIPTSVVVTFVFMFFAGMSLNIVTMASLVMVLGMVVDNSIVVMENIHRHNELGFGPRESAQRGAAQVGMAITASTITTIVVFIPLYYMEAGEMATVMRQFAVPVTVALVASLLIALTVIPLALSRTRTVMAPAGLKMFRFLEAARSRLIAFNRSVLDVYARGLAWTMRWRFGTVMLLAVIGVLTYLVPGRNVGFQPMPTVDTREINIDIEFDHSMELAEAKKMFQEIETAVNAQRTELGIRNVFLWYSSEGGSLHVYLYRDEDLAPGQKLPYSTREALDILWQRLPKRIPGAELRFSVAEASEGATQTVSVRMRGDDARTLAQYAERFKKLMAAIPNIGDIVTDNERRRQEMQLRIDGDLADQAGVTPLLVAHTVDFALRGISLPELRQGGDKIPVWAQFQEEDRKSRANLENVSVPGRSGELVALHRLMTLSKAESPQAIRRVNGKNVVTLTAKTVRESFSKVRRDIDRLIESFELPMGYSIELGDELLELAASIENTMSVLLMAVICIYVVMSISFESCLLPLSILSTIPLALIGIWWSMYLTGSDMDTVSLIGIVLMAGIVVNNGIVIVDHINQLRREGLERLAAILRAGKDRFRPVMMTALTTILGCMPLAFGGGAGGAFAGLGRALVGGLAVATVLTLFIVPMFYSLIDDLSRWFLQLFANLADLGRLQTLSTQALSQQPPPLPQSPPPIPQ